MELAGVLLGAVLVLLGGVLYLANLAVVQPARRPLLLALLRGLSMTVVVLAALVAFSGELSADGWAALALTAALGTGCLLLLLLPALRYRLRPVLGPAYDPESPVHLTALVLCGGLLAYTLLSLLTAGGVEGLAETISDSGVPAGETLFQNLLWVLAALLGVGFLLRRSPQQTLARLGLNRIGLLDVALGLGAGLALYGVVLAVTLGWVLLSSPENVAAQSEVSAALAGSVTTLWGALLLSLPVALGEEIFFRGALQPVLGLGVTSLFFMALHAQYGFTPTLLALLIVGLALGLLARWRGTWAAIAAHFAFNFVQLALAVLASRLVIPGGS